MKNSSIIRKINAGKYWWEKVEAGHLLKLLAVIQGRTVKGEVELDTTTCHGGGIVRVGYCDIRSIQLP